VTVDQVADLIEPVGGLEAVRIRIRAGSTYANRLLGDTRARTRTGASIARFCAARRSSPRRVRTSSSGPTTSWWPSDTRTGW
jgi:hypothetical protein